MNAFLLICAIVAVILLFVGYLDYRRAKKHYETELENYYERKRSNG